MDFSTCSQDGSINLFFILPESGSPADCSSSLVCAFQACKEHDLNPTWLNQDECTKTSPTKQDVFICDPFDGVAFHYLLSGTFKSVVLGPKCLLACLHSKRPVPELPSPLYNVAMDEIVITSTGFDKEEKQEIQRLAERMCGIYSNNFHEGVTHLVTKVVGSKKYMVAIEKNIPIMTGEWVHSVWRESVTTDDNIIANNEEFAKYICPSLLGLVICVSQLPRKEKDALKKIIEVNGATYSGNLEMSTTSVVVIPTPEGDKYKHANNWRIPCVTPDWVYDSVETGHALPMDSYKVSKKVKASTPTHDHTMKIHPDMSMCSTIMGDSCLNSVSHVNETAMTEMSFNLSKPISNETGQELVDTEAAAAAGLFLDGCKVYIIGTESPQLENLRKLVNAAGAVRCNVLNESVTHVVIADRGCLDELQCMDSWPMKPAVVTLDWLSESIKLSRPAEELPFLFKQDGEVRKTSEPASHTELAPESETMLDESLMKQYCNQDYPDQTANISEVPDSQDPRHLGIFQGKKFHLFGYEKDDHETLAIQISQNGGRIASTSARMVDYIIHNFGHIRCTDVEASQYVNHFYIEDCVENEILVPVEYYHMPFVWPQEEKPLSGCVIATSIYKDRERFFLIHVINLLGGNFQEILAKKDAPSRNVKSSTHLMCPTAEGDKFRGATKWGLPIVTNEWLFKCIEEKERPLESEFTVKSTRLIRPTELLLKHFSNYEATSGKENHPPSDSDNDESTLIDATPAVNRKVKALRHQHVVEAAQIETPDAEAIRKMYPTPGRLLTHNSLEAVSTPETPYGTTWHNQPNKQVRKGFKRALDALPDDNVRTKRPNLQNTTPDFRYNNQVSKNIKQFVQESGAKICPGRMENTVEDVSQETSTKDAGALGDVVIYSTKKLSDVQQELYQAVVELGGDFSWNYESKVTHVIHVGRLNDTNKDFRLARDQGKFVVSPDWVWMCRDEQKRVDEQLFPHVHNPKMSLSIISTRSQRPSARSRSKEAQTSPTEGVSKLNLDVTTDDSDETANEDIHQKLLEIEALTIGEENNRRSSVNRTKSIAELAHESPCKPPVVHQKEKEEEPESQGNAITWDDPTDRASRKKIASADNTKDTQDILAEMELPSVPLEASVNVTSSMPTDVSVAPKYVFAFSGISDEERQTYFDTVAFLGGQMSENQNSFDPEATHIITKKPSRSEKHLASIASGKWILYKSFLEESQLAGKFVEESFHEWGNPDATCLPSYILKSAETKLADSAYRWRVKLNGSGQGAFTGMKAVIFSNAERTASFARLIKAGSGDVITVKTFEPEELLGITHCFVELNRCGKVDIAAFASHGIPCLLPIYLHSFLTSEEPPDTISECIPEYHQIVHNMTPMINKLQTTSHGEAL